MRCRFGQLFKHIQYIKTLYVCMYVRNFKLTGMFFEKNQTEISQKRTEKFCPRED